MSKRKHINVVLAHIKVAVPYSPEDNLMLLTTQIREQARKLTGYIECTTSLSKIPAPAEPVTLPMRPKDDAEADLEIPAHLRRR